MNKFGIGQAVRRTEDQRLLTGTGKFVGDVNLPGQAHAHVLRSPESHAEILKIETAAAKKLPGVLAVLTGADLKADGIPDMPCLLSINSKDGKPNLVPSYPALAGARVRHVGQPVVLVVAETIEQARDAAEAVEVVYKSLPAVIEGPDALKSGAPQLHANVPGNLSFHWHDGDAAKVDAAFANAAKKITLDLINNRVVANSMETRGAVASWDKAAGTLFVHTTCQGSHHFKRVLGDLIFKIPADKVRVVTTDVGGGFGMKYFCYPEHVLTVWATKRLGRPVKWIADRQDSFLSDVHGRDHATRVDLAFDKDHKILGLRVHTVANLGAYLSNFAPMIPTGAGQGMHTGVYAIPAAYNEVKGVFTNTVPVDAYRGAGRPEAAYMIERAMDAAAFDLGIDGAELRRRNFPPAAAMPYTNAFKVTYDSGDFVRLMDEARKLSGWGGAFESRRKEAAAKGKLRGLGMSYYVERCAGGGGEAATVRIESDDTVTLLIGTQNNGQGHETAYAQVVSERLGVPFEKVRVRQGDTQEIATGGGTGGSRSIPVGAHSCQKASDALIDVGKPHAADLLEAAAVDIEFREGRYAIAGTDRSASIFEVAKKARSKGGAFLAAGEYTPSAATYPNGCHICEVEVDRDTGVVSLVDYWAVDDFGMVLNPLLLAGQVHGGVGQGVGQALLEHTVYDQKTGQLLTGSFMDYTLPRAGDLPHIRFATINIPCRNNPLGIKGAGEAGTIGATPAVVNAVVDALKPYKVRHLDMPTTPERVWQAMRGAAA
ncbi:MAG: xanthine dehydrogenase family protein molybdopterin-binding subunit [Alphaproteobacteria bacterium]|nr:xanthine dehydrogenase family protein molybdopterin-binding subunit [Alphaproteobacteria bacterium]